MNEKLQPNGQPDSGDEWSQLADEAPSFYERSDTTKAAEATPAKVGEIQKSPEQQSISLMRSLLEQSELDPVNEWTKLQEYLNLRQQTLQTNKPAHLFLRLEYWHDHQIRHARIDPATTDVYTGPWLWNARAFHSEDGSYLDFPAQPDNESLKPLSEQTEHVLRGHQVADKLIDFAFTSEHELQHDLQFQRLDKREISYFALRMAKDVILLNTLHHYTGDAENFYTNAHNCLYIEQDANDAAIGIMSQIMPTDSNLARKIVNPEAPAQFQHTMFDALQWRIRESGNYGREDNYHLTLSPNEITMPEKTYQGKAEDIVADYCDDIIYRCPDFLKLYPVLRLEYQNDGSPRTRENIGSLLQTAEQHGGLTVDGQQIPLKKLQVFYHKLFKDSKKFRQPAAE